MSQDSRRKIVIVSHISIFPVYKWWTQSCTQIADTTHTHTHNSCCWSPTPGSVLNKSSRAVDQANSSGFLSLSVGIISFVLIAPSFPPSFHQNLASWSPGCRPPLPGSMRNQYQRLGINHGGPLLSTAQHSPRAGNNNRNVYSYRDDDSVVTSSRCVGGSRPI